jgi:hypothetical protein
MIVQRGLGSANLLAIIRSRMPSKYNGLRTSPGQLVGRLRPSIPPPLLTVLIQTEAVPE